jgi:aminomethyltransferase
MNETTLTALHKQRNARMAEFEGCLLPSHYSDVADEHHAVRSAAGLFDVSHLGRIEISGDGAAVLLQTIFSRNIEQLPDSMAVYGLICSDSGGILDAALLAALPAGKGARRFLLTTSTPATAKVLRLLRELSAGGVDVRDRTPDLCQLALQGPRADAVLEAASAGRYRKLRNRHLREMIIGGMPVLVSRTGYTGETGVELFISADRAPALWDALLAAGSGFGLLPCGTTCRDILRIEAGYLRYGVDIDETRSPAEAGLMKVVDLSKEFSGKAAIRRRLDEGVREMLVGFELYDKGIPRPGGTIYSESREIGVVTSGNHSYTRRKDVGFGYVITRYALAGQEIEVEVKDREIAAKVIDMPFYRRK